MKQYSKWVNRISGEATRFYMYDEDEQFTIAVNTNDKMQEIYYHDRLLNSAKEENEPCSPEEFRLAYLQTFNSLSKIAMV